MLICWVFVSVKIDVCNTKVFYNSSFLALIPQGISTDVYKLGGAGNFTASYHVTVDTKDQNVIIALPSGNTNMT